MIHNFSRIAFPRVIPDSNDIPFRDELIVAALTIAGKGRVAQVWQGGMIRRCRFPEHAPWYRQAVRRIRARLDREADKSRTMLK